MHGLALSAFALAADVSLTYYVLVVVADRQCRALSAACSKCLIRTLQTAVMEQTDYSTGVQGWFTSIRDSCIRWVLAQQQQTALRLYFE